MTDPASIDWKGSRQIVADCRPGEEPRIVIALGDARVVALQKDSEGKPQVLFGPVSKRGAEALAFQIVAGDARAITDPLALGFLATAFLGFVVSGANGAGPAREVSEAGLAASPATEAQAGGVGCSLPASQRPGNASPSEVRDALPDNNGVRT